jgi:peptidoglycan/LPS O-acetylase OafA/YrhL
VRAFAALWVVVVHLRLGSGRALEFPLALDLFFRFGYLGVDLFGLLSGFVIAHNYAERLERRDVRATGRYLWLRVARIVPLHWFALALMLAGRLWLDGYEDSFAKFYGAKDFFAQLFLVHGFGFSGLSWNRPSWTVSSEWFCYLLFPLLAPFLVRVRSGAVAVALAVGMLTATSIAMRLTGHRDFLATADWGVLRIAGEFATGCLLQRAWVHGFARSAPWGAIGALAFAAAILATGFRSATTVVFCFAVLVYALAHQGGALARFFGTRPLVFLGDASYAIYILHFVVLRFIAYRFPGAPELAGAALLRVGLEFVAILVVAIAAHVLIENPTRRRLRSWVARV